MAASAPPPPTDPELAVVIVTHNAWELTARCLESLNAERVETAMSVTVVDNASQDDTPGRIEREFPWVQLLAQRENLGFSRGNNLALRCLSPAVRFVLLLNPDTVVPPHTLNSTVEALRDEPGAGMLGCKLVKLDGTLDHACKRSMPRPASALAYFARLDRVPGVRKLLVGTFETYTADHLADDDIGFVDAVNGAFMLVRREALDEVGLLDEGFWMYGEDLDWCLRFTQADWKILYWPRATVVHVKAGSSGSRRRWRSNLAFHRAMWTFYRKHHLRNSSPLLSAAVWFGVHLKFVISAARSLAPVQQPDVNGVGH